MGKNGYFQIDLLPTASFVKIFPPEEGGEPVRVKEITSYLQGNGFTPPDITLIGKAISRTEGVQQLMIGGPVNFFVNESMSLEPSLDKMELVCRFYPPSAQGGKLTKEAILSDLEYKGIKFGIQEEEIDRFLKERNYCTDYKLALGKPPRIGTDAKIEYFFNTNLSMKPKTRADGTVDYRDLTLVSAVDKGQRLAHLTPADPGEPGTDIFGGKIKQPDVKKNKLQFGKHIRLSEDGQDIFTEVTGHASLVQGQVFVSDVYEVPANVDNSTGNIHYDGNVHIKGDVQTGFTVEASGNIIVDGTVEGANVHAGGQIIIRDGIHGMGRGIITAGASIICKFIENATVRSEGGSVSADIILHSKVDAVDTIQLKGKKGMVTGGALRAGKLIEADYIGSEMGAQTELEVGADPGKIQRHQELQKQIKVMQDEIAKLKPVLATFTKKMAQGEELDARKRQYVQVIATQLKGLQGKLLTLNDEDEKIVAYINESGSAKVVVNRTCYAGVTIKISSASVTLKSKRDYCQYVYDGGEVVAKMM